MRHFTLMGAVLMTFAAAPAAAQTYCNATPISILDATSASVYPSPITVANAPVSIGRMRVQLNRIAHTFLEDVQIQLVAPNGQAFQLMSDIGGATDGLNSTIAIDSAGTEPLPDSTAISSRTYRAADYQGDPENWAPPANPAPAVPPPIGTGSFSNVFGGDNANGLWQLFVRDNAAGDSGQIAGGWCLSFGPPELLISEFRVRGPNGANDEFIELENATAGPLLVSARDATASVSVAASDATVRCAIPNGTILPPFGHFLCVNSVGYSLASYPAGVGSTATGNATYVTNIADNAGVAVFETATVASFNSSTRLDAVGTTSEANALYREGAGLPALVAFSIDYAFVRDSCGKRGSITTLFECPSGGFSVDTNNNANDFYFVDTNGTSAGAGQRLGAPGPQNSTSPVFGVGNLPYRLLDECVDGASPPSLVRDFTSDPANNSTFGTLDIRRTITNDTAVPITRLRYRIVDLTTFPAPSGIADFRPRTSTPVVVVVDRAPCGTVTTNVVVTGTTLEQPPSQPNGGGFNSTLSVPVGAGLLPGASIDVRFLVGLQQTGEFKLALIPEGLPLGGTTDQVIYVPFGTPLFANGFE